MAEEKSVEINLNLGSGSKPYLDYRNCDKYPGPGVDEVFDMNKIPYPNNSVTTIHSEHALEHLDHYRARTCIEEWFRVLKPGGKIHLQIPDLEECCMQYVISCRSNNRPAMEWFRYTIYGLEKGLSPNEPAEAQFHSTGFSLEEIKEEFSKIGFIIVNAQRYNGYNTPSIEIEVIKPNKTEVNKSADKVIVAIASTQRDIQQETNFNFIQTCPFPRFIYSSSPDRGLDTLLYLWQFIRREFPQATLHVLYGFNNWNKAIDQRNNEQEKKWRDQIMKDMNQSGVHYYGRVDQNTVAKMYQSADIWFYPSKFTETYCHNPASQVELYNYEMKDIKDVQIGDSVKTHTGAHQKVEGVLSRDYEGEMLDIEVTTTMRHLECTPEHPFWAIKRSGIKCIRNRGRWCCKARSNYLCTKGKNTYTTDCKYLHIDRMQPEWLEARDLNKRDYLVYPIDRSVSNKKILNVAQICNRTFRTCSIKNGRISARYKNIIYKAKINETIQISPNFMRLCGYYLAEGSTSLSSSVVCFSFNIDEQEYIQEVIHLSKEIFGIDPNRIDVVEKTANIIYNSRILGEFFTELFGKSASDKRLPDWCMTLPLNKQQELLVGLFRGDGCFVGRTNSIKMELASERLVRQVWSILLRFDIVAGLYVNLKKVPRYPLGSGYHDEKRSYYTLSYQWQNDKLNQAIGFKGREFDKSSTQQSVIMENKLFVPIRKITKKTYNGKVYNLEVEKDHSYIVENIATHNCITALEAQISKTVIVCTDLAALHTTVGDRGILIQGDAYTKEYREKALQEVFAILKDEKRRKEMVEKAYEWAKQQTWDQRAREMLSIVGLIK